MTDDRLRALVQDLKRDNDRIAGERDKALSGEAEALSKVVKLERERDERTSALKLVPLPRAVRMIGDLDYEAARRLCAKGLVSGAQKTADQIHWLVPIEELRIAATHAGLLFDRLDGAG
jgi:hypothetical protein